MFFWNLAKSFAIGDITFADGLIIGLAFLLVVFFSITMHEFAHGYVAHLCGDDTAKLSGRLTLNPVKHFDLVGILMFLIVGFGWAKPVPVNSYNFKNYKKGRIAVSAAGVTVNLILAGIGLAGLAALSAILSGGVQLTNMFSVRIFQLFLYIFLYGVTINCMLAFFNLLPIYPLDGFNLLNSFLKPGNKFSAFMYRYGNYVLLGLVVLSWLANTFNAPYLSIFTMFNKLINMLIGLVW